LLLLSQVTIFFGLLDHAEHTQFNGKLLGILQVTLFGGIWMIFEIAYQIIKRKQTSFKDSKLTIDIDEFQKRINKGE
jgi:hypothetical protein